MRHVLLLAFFLFFSKGYSSDLNPITFFQLIEDGKVEKIDQFINSFSSYSLNEIQKFIENLTISIEDTYKINISLEEAKETIFWFFKNSEITDENQVLVKSLLSEILDELIKDEKEYCLNNALKHVSLCKNKKNSIQPKNEDDNVQEIPSGIIIGGVETLAGALLWLTPFRKIGAGLMIDGVRRILNSTEEKSKMQFDERFRKNDSF